MNLNRVMCRKATEILIGQTYDEGGENVSKERCKDILTDILEDLAGDIISLTGCHKTWGEVELPECLRNQGNDR